MSEKRLNDFDIEEGLGIGQEAYSETTPEAREKYMKNLGKNIEMVKLVVDTKNLNTKNDKGEKYITDSQLETGLEQASSASKSEPESESTRKHIDDIMKSQIGDNDFEGWLGK